MVKASPTVALAQAYQAIFDHFNTTLIKSCLGQKLPQPIIHVAPPTRKRTSIQTGSFATEMWTDVKSNTGVHQITIAGECGEDRTPLDVCATFVHEMIHMYDEEHGKPGKHGYHSRSWFRLMEAVGLEGVEGPNHSKLVVDTKIIEGGAFALAFAAMPEELKAPFHVAKAWGRTTAPVAITKQGRRCKYVCPACGNAAYAPFERKLMCGEDSCGGIPMVAEG